MSEQTKRADRLDWLFAPLEEIESYRQLRAAVEKGGVVCATGLDDSQRLHMLAGLSRDTGRMLLFVTATDQLAQKAADDLLALFHGRVQLLPAREINFLRVAAASGELAARRIEALDPGGKELFTQDVYLAVETNRRVPKGFELGPFSVLSDADIVRAIDETDCPVAALSGYCFAIDMPVGTERPIGDQMRYWELLKKKYALADREESFGQNSTPLLILKRK